MREILFRGQTNNGEWVYGYIAETTLCGCSDTHLAKVIYKIPQKIYDAEWFEVNPETVGQFTGLTDKNGKKIFEGDIIRIEHDLWHGETKKTRESHIGVVFYNTKTAEFGAKIHGYSNCSSLRRWKGDFNEVIGNIHDNPELLEGGGDNG